MTINSDEARRTIESLNAVVLRLSAGLGPSRP